MRRLPSIALLIGSLLAPRVAQAGPLAVRASAEAGPELDTNANRVNEPADAAQVAPILAPLLRLTGNAALRLRLGHHAAALEYGAGGKLFVTGDGRPADELVQYASAGWGLQLERTALWLSGSYYDAFQRISTRDFRTGAAGVQVAVALPFRLRASFDVGYRGLEYKPVPDYSFHGLIGGAGLTWTATTGRDESPVDWELRAAYTAGLRFFTGPIVALPERCAAAVRVFPCTEEGGRRDFHNQLRAEATYLGNVSAGLVYVVEINRSNSYGETYLRHAVGLRFTAGMIWGLFLTAKATLQLSRFQDPFLISEVSELSFASIDDENRSSLIVQLSKELGERWALLMRWSLYVNESSIRGQGDAPTLIPPSGFLRQTLFLGVRFEYGR